jgi:GT2 family glycosyltransferase
MIKVASVVITFNRINFLKEIIDAIRDQTRKPDAIIVVNNSSSDGTLEWLSQQDDLIVVTQDNVGSSGGQYTGIKKAYDLGFDWIWTMDDDVVPDEKCLEILFDDEEESIIRTPLRFTPDGSPFENDALTYNLTNPFRSIWNDVLSKDLLNESKIPAVGITFEGPLFHRSLVEKIGLPEKKIFIFGDDTEFFIRAWKTGWKIFVYRDAKLNRKLNPETDLTKFTWKTYYMIRNIIAIDVLHGNLAVRLIRPFGYLLRWLNRAKTPDDKKIVWKAFVDGYFYKSIN